MADLTDRDRGQIILVAAFALAVIFVALALIVNSAIFTENLASRSETAGSDGALSMRSMVETNVGYSVETANRNNNTNYDTLNRNVTNSVENISLETGRHQATSGRVVTVSHDISETTNGTRLGQSDNSEFENGTVVSDIQRGATGNGTRAFVINASQIDASDNGSAFEIVVNDTDSPGLENSWRANIWLDSGTDTVHVRTLRNDSSTSTADCAVTVDSDRSAYRIDITGGTIDDEPCSALRRDSGGQNFHFGAGTEIGTSGDYDIFFRNGNEITGNFSMVTTTTTSVPTLTDDPATYSDPGIYDVTVDYAYWTSDLRYETAIRVAPGEPNV